MWSCYHQHINKSKGFIYMSEFDIEDGTILQEGLVGYGVVEVEPATLIKSNRGLITFNRELAPESVQIPGESHRTKVYEYKQRPMQCKKCQQYGHMYYNQMQNRIYYVQLVGIGRRFA